MVCITPIFFVSITAAFPRKNRCADRLSISDIQGIAQCLITARLALTTNEDTCVRGTSGQLTSGYTTRFSAQRNHTTSRIAPMTFKAPEISETSSVDMSIAEATKAESTVAEQDGAFHAV